VKCLKLSIGPHPAIEKAIKKLREQSSPQIKSYMKAIVQFIIPLFMMMLDITTDSIVVIDNYKQIGINNKKLNLSCVLHESESYEALIRIPEKLKMEYKFVYSLIFMLIPLFTYSMEWKNHYGSTVQREVYTLFIYLYPGPLHLAIYTLSLAFENTVFSFIPKQNAT
jgi:hypothetical protein